MHILKQLNFCIFSIFFYQNNGRDLTTSKMLISIIAIVKKGRDSNG